jgi:hypothetical protein
MQINEWQNEKKLDRSKHEEKTLYLVNGAPAAWVVRPAPGPLVATPPHRSLVAAVAMPPEY